MCVVMCSGDICLVFVGVGTIGVAAHLAPFLPGHCMVPCGGEGMNVVQKTQGILNVENEVNFLTSHFQ